MTIQVKIQFSKTFRDWFEFEPGSNQQYFLPPLTLSSSDAINYGGVSVEQKGQVSG